MGSRDVDSPAFLFPLKQWPKSAWCRSGALQTARRRRSGTDAIPFLGACRFIAKLTVKECLAGLDGMRVALSDDDKIAMQEAQGSSELMDMILSGEKKPGRKKMQQNTDADEGAAPSKAFQFMPSSFGASKAGARNIQRCMEDLLNLYRLSFPLQNIFDEHGNVKSTGVAWEDTVKRSPEFFSSYFGHAKKGDRSALIFKHLEDIKRALMEKPARKHGFFKLLSEIPKGSRMMNDNA